MAQMSIQVDAKASPVIVESSSTQSSCLDIYEILVDVPSGTLHVEIVSSGVGASPDIDETITADKTYYLYLDGFVSFTESLNTINSAVRITVRQDSSSGQVLESRSYRRTHTGNFC